MVRLGLNGCCYQFAAKKRKRRKNPKQYVSDFFCGSLRFFAAIENPCLKNGAENKGDRAGPVQIFL